MNSIVQTGAGATAPNPLVSAPDTFKVEAAVRSRLEYVVLAVCFLVPLVVVPGLEHPFSTPKLVFLMASVVAALSLGRESAKWPILPRAISWSLAIWLGASGTSALLGETVAFLPLALTAAAVGWFFILLATRPEPRRLAAALVLSGLVVSILACVQFIGWDPFAAAGWISVTGTAARMRVFATLGNPNFVAAFLVALMPLTAALRREAKSRALFSAALVIEAFALFATGSRAGILGIVAALIWLALLGVLRRARLFAVIAIATSLALLLWAPARPLATTVRGRAYILRTLAPHFSERPLFGYGPGSFETKYSEWEAQEASSQAMASARAEFAGPSDHAHNDYAEMLLENGAIGAAGFASLLICFLVFAFRHRDTRGLLAPASSAGVVALATVAMVDFPMHRPTEIFLLWTLMAIALVQAASPPKPATDVTGKEAAEAV